MTGENLTRCFIALELERDVIDYIEELDLQIKKKNLFTGKLTEPENLHLTLKFLGEIEESKVELVKNKLSEIKMKEFEVSLGEVGVFINKYNSILWIRLQGKQIWDLQAEIDKKLEGLKFAKEERFMSHITIARMKKIFSKDEFLDYVKNIKTKKIKFKVKNFVLKKSELKEEGPVYTDLERYELE
jgi:RNA 2',3'-cyclic 3'-phosphodiesterase